MEILIADTQYPCFNEIEMKTTLLLFQRASMMFLLFLLKCSCGPHPPVEPKEGERLESLILRILKEESHTPISGADIEALLEEGDPVTLQIRATKWTLRFEGEEKVFTPLFITDIEERFASKGVKRSNLLGGTVKILRTKNLPPTSYRVYKRGDGWFAEKLEEERKGQKGADGHSSSAPKPLSNPSGQNTPALAGDE